MCIRDRSNARYGEIVNHGVSKAEGLRRLAERLGIAVADTMAIGDSYNDLPMLKAAGHSVATVSYTHLHLRPAGRLLRLLHHDVRIGTRHDDD